MFPILFALACADVPAAPPPPAPAAPPPPPAPSATDAAAFGGRSFRADDRVDSATLSDRGDLYTMDIQGAILRFALPAGERVGAVRNPCPEPASAQAIAVTADGTRLAVACSQEVRISEVGTDDWVSSGTLEVGDLTHTLEWSPDGRILAANGPDSTLLDRDAKVVARVAGSSPVIPITADLWIGTEDFDGVDPVKGWSVAGERWSKDVPRGDLEAVRGTARVSGARARLAVVTDRQVHWFAPDGTMTSTPIGGDGCCVGEVVGAGAEVWVRHGASVVRVGEGGPVGTLRVPGRALVASPDGGTIAVIDLARVEVWRADGTRLTPGDGLGSAALDLQWSPDGAEIAAIDGERLVRLRVATGEIEAREIGDAANVAWGPGGALAAGGRAGIWLWGSPPVAVPLDGSEAETALFQRDGTLLVVGLVPAPAGAYDLRLDRWAVGSGPPRKLSSVQAPHGRCVAGEAAPSPDGNKIAFVPAVSTGGASGCVIDAATGKELGSLGDADDAAWLADGRLRVAAAAGYRADTAELWTWPGDPPTTATGWPPVYRAELAPGGAAVAGWAEGTLTVWDVATKAALATWRGAEPSAMRFSPDGKALAFTAGDGLIRVLPVGSSP